MNYLQQVSNVINTNLVSAILIKVNTKGVGFDRNWIMLNSKEKSFS